MSNDLNPVKPTKTTTRWFLKAYRGLKEQKFVQSKNAYSSCQYRGLEGLKCAVGHLLGDKAAAAFDDGMLLPGSEGFRIEGRKPSVPQIDFLCELQGAHDDNAIPEDMKKDLLTLAKRYGVKVRNP